MLSVVLGSLALTSFGRGIYNHNLNNKQCEEYKDKLTKESTTKLENKSSPYIYTHFLKDKEFFTRIKVIDLVPTVKTKDVIKIGDWINIQQHVKSKMKVEILEDHITNIPKVTLFQYKNNLSENFYKNNKSTKMKTEDGIKYLKENYQYDISYNTFKGTNLIIKETKPPKVIALYGIYNNDHFYPEAISDDPNRLITYLGDNMTTDNHVLGYFLMGTVLTGVLVYHNRRYFP